jgi:hypothetical protein
MGTVQMLSLSLVSFAPLQCDFLLAGSADVAWSYWGGLSFVQVIQEWDRQLDSASGER